MTDLKNNIKFFKLTTLVLLAVILLEILFSKKILNNFCPNQNADLIRKSKPSAETKIDKTFAFPVKKNSNDKFNLKITTAGKIKMVATKNQPLVAKEGEEFLLVYLEIENNLETSITIDSQNYFRLVDNQDKKLAPDFYNGPIQVSPISTKKDQLGFVIKSEQKEFKLQVGEIEGDKETVEFKL